MPSILKTDKGYRAHVFVKGQRASKTFRTKREADAWGHATEHKFHKDAEGRAEFLAKYGSTSAGKKVDADKILSSRVPIYRGPGVYLLFIGEAVVYIGKSNNVLNRVAEHATKGRQFDSYVHIECAPDESDALEIELIEKFLPAGNSAGFHKKRKD